VPLNGIAPNRARRRWLPGAGAGLRPPVDRPARRRRSPDGLRQRTRAPAKRPPPPSRHGRQQERISGDSILNSRGVPGRARRMRRTGIPQGNRGLDIGRFFLPRQRIERKAPAVPNGTCPLAERPLRRRLDEHLRMTLRDLQELLCGTGRFPTPLLPLFQRALGNPQRGGKLCLR
jgi:hypothetical protein